MLTMSKENEFNLTNGHGKIHLGVHAKKCLEIKVKVQWVRAMNLNNLVINVKKIINQIL